MPKETSQVIDGKKIAEKILLDLKDKISQLDRPPGLAVILVGDDPASHLYVRNKKKAAQKIGVNFCDYFCDGQKCQLGSKPVDILETINWLNRDPAVDGIIVQLPLPDKLDTKKIVSQINPKKDIDGFHPQNKTNLISPPIGAIIEALDYTRENLKNKNAVIMAKNPIFSQPLISALKKLGLKTQLVSPDEKDLIKKTRAADVLVVILGRPRFIKESMVKTDAIVIDVGTNLISKNKWVGDVDPEVKKVASWITPVPGGIGPLTVAMLMKNAYQLAKNNQSTSQ